MDQCCSSSDDFVEQRKAERAISLHFETFSKEIWIKIGSDGPQLFQVTRFPRSIRGVGMSTLSEFLEPEVKSRIATNT